MSTESEPFFTACTFFANINPDESCGSNGLPLTPCSVAILGNSQKFLDFKHENLCLYLDIIRGKHERIIIVSELIGKPLSGIKQLTHDEIIRIGYEIAKALSHLHKKGIIHRTLCPDNIYIYNKTKVKLLNYGLYNMTEGGQNVSFPLGLPKYLSPEVILKGGSESADVWTLGIILLELCIGPIWTNLRPGPVLRRILSLIHTSNPAEKIAREHDKLASFMNVHEKLKNIIEGCLKIYPHERLTSYELDNNEIWDLPLIENVVNTQRGLFGCPLEFLYHWWQLAGGDIQAELKKQGLIKSSPPVLSMPIAVLLDGCIRGGRKVPLMDRRIAVYPLSLLKTRLKHISIKDYYPLIEIPSKLSYEATDLPRVIREKDTEYQFHRLLLFRRLLKGYPYTAPLIKMEAATDIPPLLRGQVWAALLDVKGDIYDQYERIDKETPSPTDRQIDVDIPRCHQYCWLLSGPAGHRALKRLLKAWLISNRNYVYWQGLDSLTAPFLYLNFNDEARAFACLSSFVPRFLHNFFLKDNSAVIREYLCKFWQVTAYHEPNLHSHLHGINFVPELFAIPWFLTMFSHVFPLHKIVHLWDALLVEGNAFPLFMGIAILRQLRDTLMDAGFNECILLFSDLPEIHIGHCVMDSIEMCRNTPKSISYRRHAKLEFDIDPTDDVQVPEEVLFKEISPRLSRRDFLHLLKTNKAFVVDIRSNLLFNKSQVEGSFNIPYSGVHLGDHKTSSLGEKANRALQAAIKEMKTVIVVSSEDETAQMITRYLVECGVPRVCQLHGGVDNLKKFMPSLFNDAGPSCDNDFYY